MIFKFLLQCNTLVTIVRYIIQDFADSPTIDENAHEIDCVNLIFKLMCKIRVSISQSDIQRTLMMNDYNVIFQRAVRKIGAA